MDDEDNNKNRRIQQPTPVEVPISEQEQQQQYYYYPNSNNNADAPLTNNSEALIDYYESQMRDHVAAYAEAAAGAAWASAVLASERAATASYVAQRAAWLHHQHQPHQQYNEYGRPQPNPSQLGMYYCPVNQTSSNIMMANNNGPSIPRSEQMKDGINRASKRRCNAPLSVQSDESSRKNDDNSDNNNNNNKHLKRKGSSRKFSQPSAQKNTSSKRGSRLPDYSFPPIGDYKSKRRLYTTTNNETFRKSKPINSLVGKTGISVLHELCSKRKWDTPNFVLLSNTSEDRAKSQALDDTSVDSSSLATTSSSRREFEITVEIQGRVFGVGKGRSKAVARQHAARQAVTVLLPGAVFDDNGVLLELLSDSWRDSSLEGLTPMASRLALAKSGGRPSPAPSENSSVTADSFHIAASKRSKSSIYPCASSGISSMSEDDDYFASRGASACCSLLHAMWQIDPRIPDAPTYTYDVSIPSPLARKKLECATLHRPSFSCKAMIYVLVTKTVNNELNTKEAAAAAHLDLSIPAPDSLDGKLEESSEYSKYPLEGFGTGATKREAKHIASAKLLGLLFPSKSSTVEVMNAAEAARERYAAQKVVARQNKKRERISDDKTNLSKITPLQEERKSSKLKKTYSSCSLDDFSVASLTISESGTNIINNNSVDALKSLRDNDLNVKREEAEMDISARREKFNGDVDEVLEQLLLEEKWSEKIKPLHNSSDSVSSSCTVIRRLLSTDYDNVFKYFKNNKYEQRVYDEEDIHGANISLAELSSSERVDYTAGGVDEVVAHQGIVSENNNLDDQKLTLLVESSKPAENILGMVRLSVIENYPQRRIFRIECINGDDVISQESLRTFIEAFANKMHGDVINVGNSVERIMSPSSSQPCYKRNSLQAVQEAEEEESAASDNCHTENTPLEGKKPCIKRSRVG